MGNSLFLYILFITIENELHPNANVNNIIENNLLEELPNSHRALGVHIIQSGFGGREQ